MHRGVAEGVCTEKPEEQTSEVKALLAELPEVADSALLEARAAVTARPAPYPMGSGQAEEIALAAGLRPLIRQLLTAQDIDRCRVRFERAGFLVEMAPRVYGPTQNGWALSEREREIHPAEARKAGVRIRTPSAAVLVPFGEGG